MLMLHVHDTQNKTEDPSLASYAQGYAQDQLENQMKEVVKRRGSPFLFGLRNIPRKIYRTNIMHKTIINASTGHFDLLHFAFFTFWHFHTLTLTQINPFILQYVARDKRGMWAYHIPQIPFLFSTHFHVKRGPWQVTSSWLMKKQGQTLRCFGSLEQRNNLSRMMPIYQYLSTTCEHETKNEKI